MSENKDLEIIKSEVDFFDKYMADHELDERLNAILVHAERMAKEIDALKSEMNTLMNKNLPEEIREMHRRQKEYIQHQRQHLKNMTRKYKNSLESKQKALRGMSKAIDSRDFDISRLKAELDKRPEVIECEKCGLKKNCGRWVMFYLCEGNEQPSTTINFCSLGQRRESEESK